MRLRALFNEALDVRVVKMSSKAASKRLTSDLGFGRVGKHGAKMGIIPVG